MSWFLIRHADIFLERRGIETKYVSTFDFPAEIGTENFPNTNQVVYSNTTELDGIFNSLVQLSLPLDEVNEFRKFI
jgi:hypothetical protein